MGVKYTEKQFQDLEKRQSQQRMNKVSQELKEKKVVKRSKYNNKKCSYGGYDFDSQKERDHYIQLLAMQNAGVIQELQLQVPFRIEINGKLICKYVADFTYVRPGCRRTVEDVKSAFTKKNPVYRLKKKLMQAVLQVEIIEI